MKQQTLQEYYSALTPQAKKALGQLRKSIVKIIPDAEERISYGMPTFFLGKALIGYAAFKEHYSFFPYSSSVINGIAGDLSAYETSKGTIRIPYGKTLPASLLKKVIAVRIAEVAAKETQKQNKKGSEKRSYALPEKLGAPADRALANAGIRDLKQVSKRREQEIADLHGVGKHALGKLRTALKALGLSYKK